MPEMTGPELIRDLEIAPRRDDFAVLFVTGYVGEGESDDLRGYELLRKPFTVGALAARGRAALARGASEPPRILSSRGSRLIAASSGHAPLPRLELDVGAGVAVDLPRDIIGAAGEGRARLGEPQHRQRLALDPPPRPAAAALRRLAEAIAASAGPVKRS
jgi:CheY-like chemotaxis protein